MSKKILTFASLRRKLRPNGLSAGARVQHRVGRRDEHNIAATATDLEMSTSNTQRDSGYALLVN